jgi:methionine-rich copper-binding protein CopC
MIMRKYVLFIAAAVLCAMPTFARAHAFLDHANPKVGSTVNPAPQEVVLWFTQQLEPAFSSIEVRNAQGASVTAGKASVGGDRTQLRVPLKTLPPGSYKVIWRVLSVDTHRSEGNFIFRVGP